MGRLVRVGVLVGLGLATAALSGAARAQPTSEARAAAFTLFDEARTLMASGRYAEACPKLEASERMDPGIGTLYNLSDCYDHVGRTASAWIGFRDVAGQSAAAGQVEREKVARARVAELEPKLMKLKINVPADDAGVEVKRDGQVVPPATWGSAVPLDPGKHVVTVAAPGRAGWEGSVTLDKPGTTASIDVPLLAAQPGGPVLVAPLPGPGAGDAGQRPPPGPGNPPDPGTPARRPWQRPVGVVVGVLGLAGIGASVAFGFLARSAQDESNSSGHCNSGNNQCDAVGLPRRNDAVSKAGIGTGFFIGGAVLAAGGTVLFLTAPSGRPASGALAAPSVALGGPPPAGALSLGVGPASVQLKGAF